MSAEDNDPRLAELLRSMSSGEVISVDDEGYGLMAAYSREARKITAEINAGYHDDSELRGLMARLTGRPIPESFLLFPPIHCDFGRNLNIGDNVFINSGCCFQDQGGIYIGDGCQIGHQVVFATIDHLEDPEHRRDMRASPIRLEGNVWVGSHSTILRGVTVGRDSIIAAGAVVTCDVPPRTVVGGVPARIIKHL